MPINPNIALGAQQPQPINMLGQMGQLYALKGAKQEFEGNEAFREAFASGGDLNDPAFVKQLRIANPRLAMEIEAKHLAGQKTQTEIGLKRVEFLGAAYGDLVKNPTIENAYSIFDNAVAMGIMPKQAADTLRAKIDATGGDPKRIAALGQAGVDGSINAKDKMSDATTQRGQNLSHSASMAGVGATLRGQDLTDRRMREQLHPIETGMGPGTYPQFGPNAGVITPMTQAPWQPRGAAAATPSIQGGGLGSGTYGMGGGPNTLPATVGATAPVTTSPNMMLQRTQPPAAAPIGYTQATPKPPASVVNVNTQTTASEEAQKQFMQSMRVTYEQLKQAPTTLENIEKAKALVATAKGFMGTGGETMLEAAKFMNNRLGTSIDTAGIKSAEELNSRLFMGIMDNLKKMDAQPSQQQQAAMKQALGNLGTDPSAMNSVLDVFGDIVRGKVDIHNQEAIDAEARGTKFPYNPVIKLPERSSGAAGAAPIYATNGKDRIMSTDGGKTWNPAGAK
jgi:hypothetical protein